MPFPAPRRPPSRVHRGLALGLLLTTACVEAPPIGASPREEIAQQSCAARFACACEDHGFRDEEACERSTRADLATLEARAEAVGLRIDWGCVEAREVPLHHGCATYDEIAAEEANECATCRVVHGDVGVGEVCRNYGDFDDCEQGMRCVSTLDGWRCVDACHPREGSYCAYGPDCDPSMDCRDDRCTPKIALGEPCDNSYYCVDGAWCGYEGVCVPLAAPGEPCLRDDRCLGDAYCSAAKICVLQGGLGEPCLGVNTCVRGLSCHEGACVGPPGVGEPCLHGSCGDSAICDDATDRCVADDPAVCR